MSELKREISKAKILSYVEAQLACDRAGQPIQLTIDYGDGRNEEVFMPLCRREDPRFVRQPHDHVLLKSIYRRITARIPEGEFLVLTAATAEIAAISAIVADYREIQSRKLGSVVQSLNACLDLTLET